MRRSALLALMLLFACSPSVGLHTIPTPDLPQDIYASPSPSPTHQPRLVTLFFTRDGSLVSVEREASSGAGQLETAMRALMSGPSPAEQQSGLGTAIPQGVEVLRATSSQSVATVDLSAEFELAAEEPVVVQRIAQVVYTATAIPGVSRVRFLIEGDPVEVRTTDGTLSAAPVSRGDYPQG